MSSLPTITFARSTPSAGRSEKPTDHASIHHCRPFMPYRRRSTNAVDTRSSVPFSMKPAPVVHAKREPFSSTSRRHRARHRIAAVVRREDVVERFFLDAPCCSGTRSRAGPNTFCATMAPSV